MAIIESPESLIEEFQARLSRAGLLELVEVDLTHKNSGFSLDRIESNDRGKGYAEQALRILTSLCDEFHKDIDLIPRPLDDETNKEGLEKLYSRNGFIRVASGDSFLMRRKYLPLQ